MLYVWVVLTLFYLHLGFLTGYLCPNKINWVFIVATFLYSYASGTLLSHWLSSL